MFSRPRLILFFIGIFSLISVAFMSREEEYFQISFYTNKMVALVSNNLFNRPRYDENDPTAVDQISMWCLDMNERLDSEFHLPPSPILRPPRLNSSRLNRFPYRYSLWKSSSDLSRDLNRCEHHLAMRLFMIVDRICRKYKIEYMLYYGSLLGSWRHHDIIPWDDDLDVIVDNERRKDFNVIVKEMSNTLVQLDKFTWGGEAGEYYKISLKNTPSAGTRGWNFPFMDIFFHKKNRTHYWNMVEPNKVFQIEHIYPLSLRPLGDLWLPAPRLPEKLFSFDPYGECRGGSYSHRKETGKKDIVFPCKHFFADYPFVFRDNQSNSTEYLKLNNQILHTVILD